MRRVTLNGINRVGLSNWKAREWWLGKRAMIWSQEHCAWWRKSAEGYTDQIDKAGIWDFGEAWDRAKHCGPEKRIVFYSADY
jgi:hypothetical protein